MNTGAYAIVSIQYALRANMTSGSCEFKCKVTYWGGELEVAVSCICNLFYVEQ